MNEDLKEILDALDYNNDIDLADIKRYPLSLTTKQQHILFDYITNLQERIDKATEFIKEYHKHRDSFKWNEQDYIDVIDEIEKILGGNNE